MPSAGGRILIVDDNKVNRLLLSRSVEMLGHAVVLAENGRIAMQRLADGGFDLLLLDIEMPEMDGFEVLRLLRHGTPETSRRSSTSQTPTHSLPSRCCFSFLLGRWAFWNQLSPFPSAC